MEKEEIMTNLLVEDNVVESLEEVQPKKYRNWTFILYEDSTSYNFRLVMRLLKSHKKWAYVRHEPEKNEGKPHYHFILKLDNATKKDTLSNKLGLPSNYISNIISLRTMNRYLVHADDDDKIQYGVDEVNISKNYLREFFKSFDDRMSEDEILDDIFKFIETNFNGINYFTATRELILHINANCYDTIYKRYRNEILDYLKNICI